MNNEEKILSMLEQILEKQNQFEADQAIMKADIAYLQHDLTPKVDRLLEGMAGINEKFARLDRVEERVESHGHRIFALEQKAQ